MSDTPKTFRRRFQFGLKSLIMAMTLASVGAWLVLRWLERGRRQHDAVATLCSDSSATIWYEKGLDPETDSPPVPDFLRGLLGFDHFYDVEFVALDIPTDEQLKLLANFPNLRNLMLTHFNFGDGPECTEVGLQQIQSLEKLDRLDLRDIPALNDRVVASISSLTSLRRLTIGCGDNVTDAGLAQIARLSELESLTLNCGRHVTDIGLAQLGKLRKLQGVSVDFDDERARVLEYKNPPRGRALACLGDLKLLEWVRLTGDAALTGDVLLSLAKLPDLKVLGLHSEVGISDDVLLNLGMLTAVENLFLDCGRGTETDTGLASLAGVVALKKLEIHLGPAVSDAGLECLNACPNLRRLKLYMNNRVTGEGLGKLRQLQYLQLDLETRADDAPPFRICVPKDLEDVVIRHAGDLNDEDLALFAGLAKLRYLEFFWCNRMTDRGLEQLKPLKQLKMLGINWCEKVSDGGIAGLRKSLPNCEIQAYTGGGSFGLSNRF